ncbi:response regulator [Telluribacter humicola]|uniref:response regulator n=1 Tax=Telluribacter humicola TaxID=1720261 RepID=UPI00286E167E|nr:response regulator [Telluribacter humicola]
MKSLCYLIDDDTEDHYLFAAVLKEVCPNLAFAGEADSRRALEILQEDSDFVPSYIFLDLNMPNLNGMECLAEIKKIDRLKEVPIFMFSTSSFQKDINEAAELGSARFITKPGSYNELIALLNTVIPTPFCEQQPIPNH